MAIATRRYPLAYQTFGDDEIHAVLDALVEGRTTAGPRVAAFEQVFAKYVGRSHAVMVNSGSSADLLVAYGLGPPIDKWAEVLIPAVTWPTQVWSCIQAGYRVRLVDVDPETLQMSTDDLLRKVDDITRAVFLVHVLGNVGDMDETIETIRSVSMITSVIEDCCEALGSRWNGQHAGTFGQAAAFSFFFSHLINTMEGGMVVCDDDHDYRLWRTHGWEPQPDNYFSFPTWGMNLRPTELQGAFGIVQMTKLEQFKAARQLNFDRLKEWIDGKWIRGIRVLPECEPSWHGFPMMLAPDAPFTKTALCQWLERHGIETRPIIAGNIARQKAVMDCDRVICGPLPGADQVHSRGFYIGLASFDDSEGCAYVAEVFRDFMRGY